jgi:hypothetical protein
MSIYNVLKGFNQQEADTLDQKRKSLLIDDLDDTRTQRRKDLADSEAANKYARDQLSATQGGAAQTSPVSMAAQQGAGLAPTGAAPGTSVSQVPQRAVASPAAPIAGLAGAYDVGGKGQAPAPKATEDASTPALPKVTITAKRDDDFNSQFAARREYLLKNGRADLAGKVDQEWNAHFMSAIQRENAKLDQMLQPDKAALAKGDAQEKKLAQMQRVIGLALSTSTNPVTAPLAFEALNKFNDQHGIWQGEQQAASFAPMGKGRIMLMDTEGKPITDGKNNPLAFSKDEWAKLTGVAKEYKFEKLEPGQSLIRTDTRTGKATTAIAGAGEKPLTAEQRLVEADKQTKVARDRVDEKLQRDNQTGQFLNSSEDVLIVSARAKIRAAELVKQGVPGDKAGVQALDESMTQYRRDQSIAGKGGADRLPKTPTGTGGAPAAASAKKTGDYSKLW